MKQKIYILGLFTVMVVFAGTLFKMMHWPGAGYLLILGIFFLVFIFLPMALVNHYKTQGGRQNLALYLVIWITCLVVFTSMLFKILHWPGAGYLLLIALPFPFIVFLPVYLYVTSKQKDFEIYNTVFILFLLASVSVFSALLSLNVSLTRVEQGLVMANHYYKMESVLKNLPSAPVSPAEQPLVKAADQVLAAADDCMQRLSKATEMPVEQWGQEHIQSWYADSRNMASDVLGKGPEPVPGAVLGSALRQFIGEIKKIKGAEELAELATDLLDYPEPKEGDQPWHIAKFQNYLGWVVVYLQSLQTNVIQLRNEALMLAEQ